jgi:hypothetical protein
MIRNFKSLVGIALVCAIALYAETIAAQIQETQRTTGASAKAITYNPPKRSAPAGRVGGSTRGTAKSDLVVEVLAPDHVGLSAVDQPVLYWYLSRPVTAPLEITIDTVELSAAGPLLEKTLDKPWPAGISALSMRDMGVRLKPGVTYRWSAAVITDPAHRSVDVVASGLIQYVRPATGLPRADDEARIYAESGYWYDAVNALSRGIERRPDRRRERADLLEQVGLAAPAAFDRATGPAS